jgi:tRNA threonylcarbamoyladenosine biosynthesis protein TsaE
MTSFVFQAADEADTSRLGAILADLLPDQTVVALVGTLGAGKTRLVQAVAAAAGIPAHEVTSPTFVLCHSYRGRRTFHHFDVYRLRDQQEFLDLGPEEYFESAAVTFIEWADKIERLLPPEHLRIVLQVVGPTQRRVTIEAVGTALVPVVKAIASRLATRSQADPSW